jgi:hypothetical protein
VNKVGARQGIKDHGDRRLIKKLDDADRLAVPLRSSLWKRQFLQGLWNRTAPGK